MKKSSFRIIWHLTLTMLMLALVTGSGLAAANNQPQGQVKKFTQADRQAAAVRANAAGLMLPTAGAATMAMPGTAPHYFSVGNYANSPLRMSAATVDFTGTGTGAMATATVDPATGAITAITVMAGGSGYTDPTGVTITSPVAGATGATATATVDLLTGAITNVTVVTGGTGYITPGIRKFVDTLPGLGATAANNLGQYIPVATADTTTYPGTDYYEIAVVQYQQQMHSDLPPTTLRGYVQLATSVVPGTTLLSNPDGTPILLPNGTQAVAVDIPHYLGPLIAATKDKPVRILFRNLLPLGQAGNLFIPVDTTVMGSGMGPLMGGMAEPDPQNPMCGMLPKPAGCFPENRATLHLHGGISPWISDGTPHQWITPANEATPYPKGVSVVNVPDMPDPGPGAMTFFYTNQQSARLMFYHDHAWGITRLNVYAGEAAAYTITDPTEQALITQGVLPADTLPLIIQDKTFVPSTEQLAVQDPLWDATRWGGYGSLWVPHVYVPAQNPGDSSGVNQFGRWAYGPWFWPPTANITYPPIPNPYYDPACNPNVQWCEPMEMPSTPFLSMGMEAFNDTPVVNGTVYPTVTVEPKPYRLRILNAANDRFFNLQLYTAIDAAGIACDAANLAPAAEGTGIACTEVALNPAEVTAALADPSVFPTPVPTTAGPNFIQFGTEGGFLPAPVVIPNQTITWVTDPTVFNAGNVDKHALLLGPAERADVVVDFSAYAGQTLILYNDSPAAFPARDPRYDYYTGNGDYTSTGGAPSTPAGYGPNTRTVMQIKVAGTPAAAFNLAALQTAFLATSLGGQGVFANSQHPIIVGQGAYNSAYGTTFQDNGPRDGLVRIYDEYLDFDTIAGVPLRLPLERKAIQDEMGEAFEHEYGRMSGNLGVETPNAQAGLQQNLILYPYVNPATEIFDGITLPPGVEVTPISTTTDGTQIWKITHNGVDTHPIHFHLFDVQVINRVGWDGIIRKTEANELGWKDTLRVSPLEDTIVAMRPIIPKIPFGLVDSVRPLNPMMPLGSTDMFNNTDIFANPISPPITNEFVNFGWEYVWHCHILSHEEMDMMRPMSVYVTRGLPTPPAVTYTPNPNGSVSLAWADGTPVDYLNLGTWGSPAGEVGFRIERADVAKGGKIGAYATIGTQLANQTTFTDTTAVAGVPYRYRVVAWNAAGDSFSAPVGAPVTAPLAPTGLTATLQTGPQVALNWTDNATNEVFFVLERAIDGGTFILIAQLPAHNSTGKVSYTDTTVMSNHSYQYRIAAANGAGTSAYATSNLIAAVATPAAPSSLAGSAVRSGKKADVTLTWLDNSNNETGFTIEQATNPTFTVGLTSIALPANTTTITQKGLYRGVTYYFRIKAVNLGGTSGWSNVFSIVTP